MTTPFALSHVSVLTCDADGTIAQDQTIVVDPEGRIARVGPSAEVALPDGYRQIDCTGKFAMPGLINAHAHLFSDGRPIAKLLLHPRTQNLATWFMRSAAGRKMLRGRARRNLTNQLNSGVTTVRTVGDVAVEVIETRAAIERGDFPGPRVLASGPLLAITGGHGAPQIARIADTPEQARAATRKNIAAGALAIKISATGGVTDALEIGHAGHPEMTEEQLAAVCEEAHARGIVVAAHAQSVEGVKRCLRAGVDTIEHGSSMDDEIIELYRDNPRSLRGWSAMVPTVQACMPLVKLDRSVTGINEIVLANAELVMGEMLAGIRTALDNEIALGVGNDSGVTYVTHSNFWRELDQLIRFGGLTPVQALHGATRSNARILGLEDEAGSLEAGKSADVVVLDENPLNAIRALEKPTLVVARGRLIDDPVIKRIPEIDRQLDTIQ